MTLYSDKWPLRKCGHLTNICFKALCIPSVHPKLSCQLLNYFRRMWRHCYCRLVDIHIIANRCAAVNDVEHIIRETRGEVS